MRDRGFRSSADLWPDGGISRYRRMPSGIMWCTETKGDGQGVLSVFETWRCDDCEGACQGCRGSGVDHGPT